MLNIGFWAANGAATPMADRADIFNQCAEIERSSGNVYADLGIPGAGEMLVKARLSAKMGEIIRQRQLAQQQAVQILGVPQPKWSCLLRSQFRGISAAKMLACQNRLGRDVDIVVRKADGDQATGRTSAVLT